ncbi:hypothetical protein BD779DRAFT_359518 [Infundibulicybe gibba]|nr:hypothetical protein BD779DRAFT_359518 [Infundibulicybe gibba]
MSRHRLIRNLNIDAELDDDALSDGGEEYMTPEQQAQMISSLEQVRHVIGGEENSGLSDHDLKDVLWNSYFDVEKAVQWAIEEQERRHQVQERKDVGPSYQENQYGQYSELFQSHVAPVDGVMEERPRVPLIVLAQQQQGFDQPSPYDVMDDGTPRRLRSALTPISERTEIPSTHPQSSSSPQTSYGQILGSERSVTPVDPDLIPVSPSKSALVRLSTYEPAPSLSRSESRSTQASVARAPSEPIPPIEVIPDIPDSVKSSKLAAPKMSKLSKLASARSNATSRSESSRSSGTALTGSVKTYPALRPSAQSTKPPSSTGAPSAISATPVPSSTSALIQRAIHLAMHQEEVDRAATTGQAKSATNATESSNTPSTPTSTTTNGSPYILTSPPVHGGEQPPRQLSKLALLAQAKADASKSSGTVRSPKVVPSLDARQLPKERTEYLMPIANGSSVTTAITTSYQSLYSLTNPARSPIIPAQFVVPLGATPPPEDGKRSKLAMKIEKANKKHRLEQIPTDEVITPPVSPMFYPQPTRTRASPSAFASTLIDKILTYPQDKEGREEKGGRVHRSREHKSMEDQGEPRASEDPKDREHHKHQSRKHRIPKPPVPDFSPQAGSAFDGPSPDDIVFNARKGTALSQQRGGASGHGKTSKHS